MVTIDTVVAERPTHPRISYLSGSSTDPAIIAAVRGEAVDVDSVLVTLDSDHAAEHVLAELDAYAPLVTLRGSLIVEDTNVQWPTGTA